jgi:hypothetical protein
MRDINTLLQSMSIAGYWKPVDDSYLKPGDGGNLATVPYAIVRMGPSKLPGIVLSGWHWSGEFGPEGAGLRLAVW